MQYTAKIDNELMFSFDSQSFANPRTEESILASLDNMARKISDGTSLEVYLYNKDTTDFHLYEFEYEYNITKFKDPRKWLLNNMLYSLFCRETAKDMADKFIELKTILDREFQAPSETKS
jgi:hypothetical protein